MIKYIVILFISLFSSSAFCESVAPVVGPASYPAVSQYYVAYVPSIIGSSAEDVCSQYKTYVTGHHHTTAWPYCYVYNENNSLKTSSPLGMNQTCASGYTLSGSTCNKNASYVPTCPAADPPYTYNSGTNLCTRSFVPCSDAGEKSSQFGNNYTLAGAVGDTVCINSCSYYTTDSISSVDGTLVGIGRSAGTSQCTTSAGATATPPVTSSSPPSPSNCMAQGKSYITMNSVTQCVGIGTAGATPVTVSQTQQTAVSGVAGATTIKDTYTQQGDAVTLTRVETPVGGGAAVVTTTTAPASKFCESNPDASMCKEKKGSASGGESCSSPPACDGDAILCAHLRQTWTARCESQTSSAVRTLGENVLNGADPLANKPDPANPVVVPVGTLNTSEIFSGTSCPAPIPMNFSVMGRAHSLSFDLTPFCTLGGVLGVLNVLASLFAAGRIISGGI